MPKEILLYKPIDSDVAERFIIELTAAEGEPICVRGNCPGGSVYDSIGMIQKFREYDGEKEIRVDGSAQSAFAYMLLYAKKVTCLSVTNIMFHRANLILDESMEYWSDTEFENAVNFIYDCNKMLRSQLEAKIPQALWVSVTGVSYDRMFDMTMPVLDISLSAYQAKQLGIISDIIEFSPEVKKELVAFGKQYNVAALGSLRINEQKTINKTDMAQNEQSVPNVDLEKMKAEMQAEATKNALQNITAMRSIFLGSRHPEAEAVANKFVAEGKSVSDPEVLAKYTELCNYQAKLEAAARGNAPNVFPNVGSGNNEVDAVTALRNKLHSDFKSTADAKSKAVV